MALNAIYHEAMQLLKISVDESAFDLSDDPLSLITDR